MEEFLKRQWLLSLRARRVEKSSLTSVIDLRVAQILFDENLQDLKE